MNNKQLLITDFDGCLTNDFDLDLAIKNINVLNEVYDIIISSGRELGTMKKLIEKRDFWQKVKYVFLANGAISINEKNIEYTFLCHYEKKQVLQMSLELRLFSNGVELYYCLPSNTRFVDNYNDAKRWIDQEIYEIKIAIPRQKDILLNWCVNYINSKGLNGFFDFITNKDFFYIEIKAEGINKISKIPTIEDISSYESVKTLGDGINDIHLLCMTSMQKNTTNYNLQINNINYVKDVKSLICDYGKDVSSKFTNNKVRVLQNIVLKTFESLDKYKIEKSIYRLLDPSLCPKVLGELDEEKTLLIEKCNVPDERNLSNLIDVMNRFHKSTLRNGMVFELGSEEKFKSWKEYLKKQFPGWQDSWKCFSNYDISKQKILDRYINDLKDGPVAIIHRDVRWDNIGEIDGRYVLFDFELAMWGNPIWDFARLLYESDKLEDKKKIISLSGYQEDELYINQCLYALSFLHYFKTAEYKNQKEITKCIDIIKEIGNESK